jgi:translation initiation factor 2 beta subunit (eIF-2beta)/eIF-5
MKPPFKPTNEILEICELIDIGISAFSKTIAKLSLGTFEYEVTAYIHITSAIRLLESIAELAKKDLIYVHSALVMARSIFEGLVKTAWMLFPDDNFTKETRYVSYLQSESDYLGKTAKMFGETNESGKQTLYTKSQVDEFKSNLTKLLLQKGYQVPIFPNFREILKELKEDQKYLYYIKLSQYSHFSHHSTMIYQKHLGINKVLTEDPNIDLWKWAFITTIPAFKLASNFLFASLGSAENIYSHSEWQRFEKLIHNL